MSSQSPETESPSGLPHALGAYLVWGLLPIYLHFVHSVPPFEFVGWRLIFTLPICLLIVALRRQIGEVTTALGNPRTLAFLFASALLIGANWLIYVIAVATGHVLAASLGYFMNPLVNVLAGTLFFRERLSRRQWIAVAIAATGVLLLAWDAREMLGIALALAASFSGYGLVRRITPVASLPGLTVESILLILPAIGIIAWQARIHGSTSFGHVPLVDMLLPLSGIITAVPLLLYATAAKRMDFSTLGFVQYLAPTLQFLVGLFVFREPLLPAQLACFMLIWTAAAIFVWDLFSRRRSSAQAPA